VKYKAPAARLGSEWEAGCALRRPATSGSPVLDASAFPRALSAK